VIKLTKLAEPQVLQNNGSQWLADLKAAIASNIKKKIDAAKSKYNHRDIKDQLIEETAGKCAYCESLILHISFGDIEHIIPKNPNVDQTFVWSNLTLACDVCNTAKSSKPNVFDPYVDNVEDHFKFLGPMILPATSNDKATFTVKQLQLNRLALIERRMRRIDGISTQANLISKTTDLALKEVLVADLIENDCGDSAEYSAFVRQVVATLLPGVLPQK
jgi:uncharacterized protein (TIGR02646 family)